MKSERGITLISLIIYIIAMTVVIAVMSTITNYFYSGIRTSMVAIDSITEYAKFNSFFTEEVNVDNIKIVECSADYIVFDNGVQYKYVAENKGIYRNSVKICAGVEQCNFAESIQNGNETIEVDLQIKDEQRTVTYTLKNW